MIDLLQYNQDSANIRNLLRLMVKHEVFKFGQFELKSGQLSPIYIDLRECFGYPVLMEATSSCLTSLIRLVGSEFQGVVGVPYAALPYATIVSQNLKQSLIIIRKEAKSYGTKKLIEGKYENGQKVIIIEDVVTTGGSIIEVINTLRADGLIVEDVFCLLDREQGGRKKLKDHGINLHSLLNMQNILSFLISAERITSEVCLEIIQKLNLSFSLPSSFPVTLDLEDVSRFPINHQKRDALNVRSSLVESDINKKIINLMIRKESNICLAIDYTESNKILELVNKVGQHVIAIKIHSDIITDFSIEFTEKLVNLSQDMDFLILEDRKFADIGNTNLLQFNGLLKISEWADLITVHGIQGVDSVAGVFREVVKNPDCRLKGILLIAQLSCTGNLTKLKGYTEEVVSLASDNKDVVCGFICQTRVSKENHFLNWTPGVNIEAKTDGSGQQWRSVDEAVSDQGNDIIIVGRGVTSSTDPVEKVKNYKVAGWTSLYR
ncbi:unnamed protein product [Auanema sp. JU1783]|nr:unnamed protein product [Auanema sp. JU1783]